MTGEQPAIDRPMWDTGALLEPVRSHQNRLNETQLALDGVVRKRDEAMAFVAKPFTPEITRLQTDLKGLEGVDQQGLIKQQLLQTFEQLPDTEKVALSLLVQRDGGISKFVEKLHYLTTEPEDSSFHHHVLDTVEQFRHIQTLHRAVEASGRVAVGIVELKWHEFIDEQADFEGRDSSTGEYTKLLMGYFGTVNAGSFDVETELENSDHLQTSRLGTSLNLVIEAPHVIEGRDDWGRIVLREFERAQPLVTTLARAKQSDSTFDSGDEMLRWGYSEKGFSLMRGGLHGSTHRVRDTQTFLLHGDGLEHGLRGLLGDKDIDGSLKPALQAQLQNVRPTE